VHDFALIDASSAYLFSFPSSFSILPHFYLRAGVAIIMRCLLLKK
jgi:hypothetical protein